MIRKLMLIDDDAGFRALVKSNLEATGEFQVVATADAENAVTLAKIVSPDLIFLDMVMPGMDGLTAADNLMLDSYTKDIPVAFLTSLDIAPDALRMNGKFSDLHIISKSAGTGELIESAEKILQARKAHRNLPVK
ncbi:MAG: response regulator [Nitrospirae bacterium]|nr:response regulator [Nitrospirota bacterium]